MQMYESVGHNMKEIRKNRMPDIYSVKYTVGIINSYLPEGREISEGLYYRWENEERTPTVMQITAIAKAFNMSETRLIHWHTYKEEKGNVDDEWFLQELRSWDRDTLDKVKWIFAVWQGDTRALVDFMLLYANLPVEERRDLAVFGARVYSVSTAEKKIDKRMPQPDMEYMRTALLKLW